MSWQDKGRKAAMGQFVRAKAERMVLVRFDGEPIEKEGKDFQGNTRQELQFPVTFWDERSVALKYKEGEASRIVLTSKGEAKMFPVSSPPLMRTLLEEDEEENVMGRTFIISHTGTAKDTVYKMREVNVPKQKSIVEEDPEDDAVGPNAIPEANEQDAEEEVHYAEEAAKRTKSKPRKIKATEKSVPGSKEDFKAKVAAHAKKEKEKEAESPSVEELQQEEREDEWL
jgi:hypothetical protein